MMIPDDIYISSKPDSAIEALKKAISIKVNNDKGLTDKVLELKNQINRLINDFY